MAENSKAGLPDLLTTTEVATLLGLTSRRVQQLVQDGVIKRDDPTSNKRRKFKSNEVVKQYIDYLQKEVKEDDEYTLLKKKKLKYEVEIKKSSSKINEMKLNEYRGRMHSAEDVEYFTDDLVFMIRGALMALPSRLAIDVAKESDPNIVREMIEKEVNSILLELSNYKYDKEKYLARVMNREGLESIDMDDE